MSGSRRPPDYAHMSAVVPGAEIRTMAQLVNEMEREHVVFLKSQRIMPDDLRILMLGHVVTHLKAGNFSFGVLA